MKWRPVIEFSGAIQLSSWGHHTDDLEWHHFRTHRYSLWQSHLLASDRHSELSRMGLGSFMYWFMYYQGEKLPKLSKTIQNHQVHVVIGSDWSDFDVLIHIIPPISIIHQIHQIQIPQIPQIPQISASIWRGHGASYPDVLPEVRFTAGINMTCVEPDGQVKPAWGVLGAADRHGGSSCWRNVGERIMWFPCDSLGEGKIVWDVGLIKFDERWWVLVNWVPESLDSLDMGLGRTTDSAGNWKREYTIETVLDALRREMSGSQARLMDTFQIRMISKYPKPKIQSCCSSR